MDKKEKEKKQREDASDKSEASSAKDKKTEPLATVGKEMMSKAWDPLAQLTTEEQRKAFARVHLSHFSRSPLSPVQMKENLSNISDPERKAFCTDAEII